VEERARVRQRQSGTAQDIAHLLERIANAERLLTKAQEEKNQKTLELIKTEKLLRQNQLKVSLIEQEAKDKADEIRRISIVQKAMDRATPLLSPTIPRTPPRSLLTLYYVSFDTRTPLLSPTIHRTPPRSLLTLYYVSFDTRTHTTQDQQVRANACDCKEGDHDAHLSRPGPSNRSALVEAGSPWSHHTVYIGGYTVYVGGGPISTHIHTQACSWAIATCVGGYTV